MEYASKTEAINGADNTKIMTPLRVKQSILANSQGSGGDGNYMDPVPINSIFDYEGNTVPDGFVEIDPVVIPTKTSDLTNDSGFIDNKVNDLINYTKTSDLNNALDLKANASDLENIKSAIDYKPTGYIGDIVVENVVSRNLFNINSVNPTFNLETSLSKIENGIRATALGTGQSIYSAVELDKSLMGKTVTLSATITPSSTNTGALSIFFGTTSEPYLSGVHWFTESGSATFTIPSTFPSGCDKLFMNVHSNGGGTGVNGAYVDYTNIQIEEGTVATDYVPYLNLEEAMQENSVYSTSEQRIGTWLGKPLYRKVIEYINTSDINATGTTLTVNIPHSISNLQLVTNARGFASGGWMFPLIVGTGTTFTNTTGIYNVNISNIQLRVTNDRWTSNGHFYFVLEYTKTTD